MKRQVVYIHGGDSFNTQADFLTALSRMPVRNLPGQESGVFWTKTLPEDLGDDFEVFMPTMPNKQNAHYEEWKVWFERHFTYLSDGIVLVGLSLGDMFLAKYLSENEPPFKVKAVYLLAAPGGEYPKQDDGNDCQSFRFSRSAALKLANRANRVEIWHSTDDPVVPVSEADWYGASAPGVKIRLFLDKNHFLVPTLPELLDALRVE